MFGIDSAIFVFQMATDKDIEIIDNTMSWFMQGPPLSKTLHITGMLGIRILHRKAIKHNI